VTPEQWDHVCGLFEKALERPPSERQAFVDSLDEAPFVRQELASLLAQHDDEAPSILELRLAPLAAEVALRETAGELPASIGPYQPVRELGRGGMGVVYLARRADGQFEQDVAVKLVRHGMESDEVRRRFLLERQLLARLQHPGIARLLDGGITADGRAWFALEYVQGVPLYDYCKDSALELDARLRLFLKVCEAVAYAHRNLVVHRDLKPGNILVTAAGEPRLLDFGIAKLLEEDAQPGEPHTRASLVLVTPEYGAPEQVAGEPITTATDVYALGMILYELLTGKRPYDLSTRSPLEMYEVILNTQPTRPSLATRGQRGDSVPRWARELRGDLDIIVMTALAKAPDRRYPSAAALARDIERYLDGRPIEARADSVLYVTRKFLRRHWLPASAAALVLASLIGGLAAAAWQGGIASREARRAESISTFLLDMLSSVDPSKAQGRDVTVREVLDEAARRLDAGEASVSGVPSVESAIRATVGSTYRALGQYEAAETQAVRALELSRAALGESHPDTVRRMSELGDIYFEWGRIDEAERWYQEARRVASSAFGENHELAAHATTQLAGILFRRGDYAGAERELAHALEVSRSTHGAESEQALLIQARLASSIGAQGRLEESAVLLADTLAVQERVMGVRTRAALMTMGNLANVYQLLERYDEAVALGERAYAVAEEVLPADHPEMLETMGRLAALYFEADDNVKAEPLFEKALARHVEVLGEAHWRTLLVRANYAALLADTGRLDRALVEWSASIEGLSSSVGAEHPMTVEIIGMRDEALGSKE
jgi:serine/threonine-protein kinase